MHIMTDAKTSTARRRRVHSDEFKCELVARSLEPGASVSAIALEAGINANLLFAWRRAHLQWANTATIERQPATGDAAAVLLPVEVVAPTAVAVPSVASVTAPRSSAAGSIEIDIGGARIRLRGLVDEASLRCVLQAL